MSTDIYIDTGDRVVVRDSTGRDRTLEIIVNEEHLTVPLSSACHIYEGLQKALAAYGMIDDRGRVT